jgi:hypothetical protein
MRRAISLLMTFAQVLNVQRQTWVIPAVDLSHRIEQELFTPPPMAAGGSGHIARPASLSRCLNERLELRRWLKSPRRIER